MSFTVPFLSKGNRVDRDVLSLTEASDAMYRDIAYRDYKRRHYLEIALKVLEVAGFESTDQWLNTVDRVMVRATDYARGEDAINKEGTKD
jgi:hypothetical protein